MDGKYQYNMDPEEKKDKCSMSTACGFGLVLLAILIAAAVGIIVYFAAARPIKCECSPQTSNFSAMRFAELQVACHGLAQLSDPKICGACPMKPPMTSVPPTMVPTTPMPTKPMTTPAPPLNMTLPGEVDPYHYNLELDIEFGAGSSGNWVKGKVSIFLDVNITTKRITLNSRLLNITSQSFSSVDSNDTPPDITLTSMDSKRYFFVVELSKELVVGKRYRLDIEYNNRISSAPYGIYLSPYETATGENKMMVVGSFHPPRGAKLAFPCFDEPLYKATFNMTIIRQTNYNSIFNTDILETKDRGNKRADVYVTTPKMSTDALALAVVDFNTYLQSTTKGGVEYLTYIKPTGKDVESFAHNNGFKTFQWLEDNIMPAFPMDKMKNLAVRNHLYDASSTWGFVTYKENILFDPATTTTKQKQSGIRLVAQELANQWFGNLVTPRSWQYLWLSQGLSSFYPMVIFSAINPTWREVQYFVVDQMQPLLEADAGKEATLMEEEPRFFLFERSKAATLMRTIYNIVGRSVWSKAMKPYLKDAEFCSVENFDLWKAINDAAASESMTVDIGMKMETWLTQLHYPVVMVTRVSKGIIEVEQHLYKKKGMEVDSSKAKYEYRWDVPITYATSSDQTIFNTFPQPSDFAWLSRTQTRTFVEDSKFPDLSVADSWVLVNPFQVGYYRVNYQESNWMALMKQLEMNHTVIPAVSRAQLIDDAFALNRAGELKLSIALRTLNFLKKDTDYIPWTPAEKVLGQLDSALIDTVMYGSFQAFMRNLVKESYAKYGLTAIADEPPLDAYQRARIAELACHYGVQDCLTDVAGAFDSWMENATSNRPVPDLLNVVACYGIQECGISAWRFVHNLYLSTTDYRFAQELIPSLACAKEQWLIKSILHMSMDTAKIKTFHQSLLIKSFLKTHVGREATFVFIEDNAERLRTSVVLDALHVAAEAITSSAFPEEVEMVARKKPRITKSQVEEIKSKYEERKKMIADKKEPVMQWLTENGFGSYFLQEKN